MPVGVGRGGVEANVQLIIPNFQEIRRAVFGLASQFGVSGKADGYVLHKKSRLAVFGYWKEFWGWGLQSKI
eukprot:scaffold291981_cov13-Tisochrysis_lutea.AAC.1